jgi:ABC-type branched-subunit amino acid transport system permease subunit
MSRRIRAEEAREKNLPNPSLYAQPGRDRLVREILGDYFRSWLIFVGLVYIALVVFLPSGLYPLFARRR